MNISELKTKEGNPRKITPEALKKLAESIKKDPEFMVLRPMVVDDDGSVLGGNQRLKAIQSLGMDEVPDTWVVKASDLNEEQKRRFILVDNAPSGMAGDWDIDVLAEGWEVPELQELGFDLEVLGIESDPVGDGQDDTYSKKIEAPIYQITGDCPDISELVDETKTNSLKESIQASDIPEDIKAFLSVAADRHTVFDFSKIAEYYAHAPSVVQELMEESALVIIDFDKAIESGFVRLSEKVIEQYKKDTKDA